MVKNVKRLRITELSRPIHGMARSHLAKLVGVTAETLKNYDMGLNRPSSMDIINRICQALGCESDELIVPYHY